MYRDATPYHRRVARRLARSRERQLECLHNKFVMIDRFMLQFELAWHEYYRTQSGIQYSHGWYFLHGKRYRHEEVERKLAVLLARLQEQQSPNPDKEE